MEQTQEPMEKEYITVIELTKLVPVSRAQVYNMVKSNKLKHYRFGKKILFKKEEVVTTFETNTNP